MISQVNFHFIRLQLSLQIEMNVSYEMNVSNVEMFIIFVTLPDITSTKRFRQPSAA
jgi:hypothetical protein